MCVYAFSTAITRLQACTTDRKAMSAAIGKLNAGGDTALYDALLSVSGDQRKQGGRQVMIVLSDGADTASRRAEEPFGQVNGMDHVHQHAAA